MVGSIEQVHEQGRERHRRLRREAAQRALRRPHEREDAPAPTAPARSARERHASWRSPLLVAPLRRIFGSGSDPAP